MNAPTENTALIQFIELEAMNQEQLIEAFEANMPKLSPQDHFVFMISCAMIGDAQNMERIAAIEGIDAATIKAEVELEAKQAADAADEKAKAKKPKAKAAAK